MSRFLVITASLALAGCGASFPKCAATDAQGVVAALQPRKQFRAMLGMAVEMTQTYAMVRKRDGARSVQKLDAAADAAVERHGAEWERNLVSGWATLGPDEIKQACTALGKRDEETFNRFAGRAGEHVRPRNAPLLTRAGAEVLEELW